MIPSGSETPDPSASLRFFTVAAVLFAILGLAIPAASGHIEVFRHNPSVLVAVHAFTLGLTALEMGAMYQLIPVLLGQKPASRVQGMTLAAILGLGALTIITGFHFWQPLLIATGGLIVTVAAFWYVALVSPGIIRSLHLGLTPAYLTGAMASLLLLVSLGVTMAFNLRYNFLSNAGLSQLGAHLAVGAGGWFGLAIMGLSYRMIGMFYLTQRSEPPKWATFLGWLTISVIVVTGLILMFGFIRITPLLALIGVLAMIYPIDFGRRLRKRRRRPVDVTVVHMYASVFALVLGGAGLLAATLGWRPGGIGALPGGIPGGANPAAWAALVLLILPGWAGNMGMGLAYKIIPFLVWFQRFAPLVGTKPVPVLAQLVPKHIPWVGVAAWNLGLFSLAVLTACGAPAAFKLAAGVIMGLGPIAFAASALTVLSRRA